MVLCCVILAFGGGDGGGLTPPQLARYWFPSLTRTAHPGGARWSFRSHSSEPSNQKNWSGRPPKAAMGATVRGQGGHFWDQGSPKRRQYQRISINRLKHNTCRGSDTPWADGPANLRELLCTIAGAGVEVQARVECRVGAGCSGSYMGDLWRRMCIFLEFCEV